MQELRADLTTFLPAQFLLSLLSCHWNAFSRWTEGGKLKLEAMREDLGTCCAPVACSSSAQGYSGEAREQHTVSEYLDYLQELDQGTASSNSGARNQYLKDFHFVQQAPELARSVYETPVCFKEDFLNWWWNGQAANALSILRSTAPFDKLSRTEYGLLQALLPSPDDFKFLYLGMAGTSTWLHHDVICSHSWSAQISGFKLWLLFEPSVSNLLVDSRTGECVLTDVLSAAPQRVKDSIQDCIKEQMHGKCLQLPIALQSKPALPEDSFLPAEVWDAVHVCVQPPRTAMFVPSGWYHQVHNLSRSLSINHNWFDSSALVSVCRFVVAEAAEVRRRIADCRSSMDVPEEEDAPFAVLCERIMRADIRCNIAQLCLLLGLLHAGLDTNEAQSALPFVHNSQALYNAIESCSAELIHEPLVKMAFKAQELREVRLCMEENGLCIVTNFIKPQQTVGSQQFT